MTIWVLKQKFWPENAFSDQCIHTAATTEIDSAGVNETAISTDSPNSSQKLSIPSNSSQCPKCDQVFVNRNNMLNHVRYKHKGVSYPCSQCNYKATQQQSLKRHVESIHEGFKYPCCQCNYKATQQQNLKRHLESAHKGVNLSM